MIKRINYLQKSHTEVLKGGVNITVLAYQQAIVKAIMSLSDALREKFLPMQCIQSKCLMRFYSVCIAE